MTDTDKLAIAILYLREIAEIEPRKMPEESEYQFAAAFGRAKGKALSCLARLDIFEEKENAE